MSGSDTGSNEPEPMELARRKHIVHLDGEAPDRLRNTKKTIGRRKHSREKGAAARTFAKRVAMEQLIAERNTRARFTCTFERGKGKIIQSSACGRLSDARISQIIA